MMDKFLVTNFCELERDLQNLEGLILARPFFLYISQGPEAPTVHCTVQDLPQTSDPLPSVASCIGYRW